MNKSTYYFTGANQRERIKAEMFRAYKTGLSISEVAYKFDYGLKFVSQVIRELEAERIKFELLEFEK